MKLLHINTNYMQSTIYKQMFEKFNRETESTLFFPTKHNCIKNEENILSDNILSKMDKYTFFRRNQKLVNYLYSKLEINEYDHILCYSLVSNGMVGYSLNKKYNMQYTVIIQNTDINMYYKKFLHLRPIINRILLNAKNIIFISKSYQNKLINIISKKILKQIEHKFKIIPFGVNQFWLDNKMNKSKVENNDAVNLIYVGKIEENKNIDGLIEMKNYLASKNRKVKLTMIGELKEKRYLSLIEQSNITYLDHLTKDELLYHYRENDIFIMISHKETFGLVYVEAMSQGLPIIYTANEGFDQQFPDGQIGFPTDKTVENIEKKIDEILLNYNDISNKCVDSCDRYNWNNIIDEYITLLRQ